MQNVAFRLSPLSHTASVTTVCALPGLPLSHPDPSATTPSPFLPSTIALHSSATKTTTLLTGPTSRTGPSSPSASPPQLHPPASTPHTSLACHPSAGFVAYSPDLGAETLAHPGRGGAEGVAGSKCFLRNAPVEGGEGPTKVRREHDKERRGWFFFFQGRQKNERRPCDPGLETYTPGLPFALQLSLVGNEGDICVVQVGSSFYAYVSGGPGSTPQVRSGGKERRRHAHTTERDLNQHPYRPSRRRSPPPSSTPSLPPPPPSPRPPST